MKGDFETRLYQEEGKKRKAAADIFKSILVLGISTIISYFFSKRGFRESNIITVNILGVLITAVVTFCLQSQDIPLTPMMRAISLRFWLCLLLLLLQALWLCG